MDIRIVMTNYDTGYLSVEDLYDMVERGDITINDYEEITGLEYIY